MSGQCCVCGNEVRDPRRTMHEQCEMARDIMEDLREMLASGKVETWIKDFIPELNFVFEEDWRLKRIFKVAERVIVKSVLHYGGGDFPLSELEINISTSELNGIFDILEAAGLASIEGNNVHLGPIGVRLCQQNIATGTALDSPDVRGPIEELRGWICVTVAKGFLDDWLSGHRRTGRPRNILKMLEWLSNVMIDNPNRIPTTLEANEIFYERYDVFSISKAQIERVAIALLGLRGKSPKVFAAFKPQPGGMLLVDLKPQTRIFLERERERVLERRRGRGRT